MKLVLKALGGLLLVLVLGLATLLGWASWKDGRLLSRTFETHTVDFPVPFPLDEAEKDELLAELTAAGYSDEDLAAIDMDSVALARAIERGEHLVSARYACADCHGMNFGGGVMVDDPMIGSLLGPNITSGEGGRTGAFTPSDWDRIVRHGVLSDGRPAAMPSIDFMLMSDQELSDIIAFVGAAPAVNEEIARPSLGPLGKVLLATGQIILSADVIEDHFGAHLAVPPPAEPTVEFGRHLAATCTGCHSQTFAGGPVKGGDPSWAPAANLTPHEDGLAGWTFEQFAAVLVAGTRPDGTQVRVPMSFVVPFGANMTETELRAIWAYLQSLPAAPTPD